MAKCTSCGADLPDYYTSCPNCGSNNLIKGAPAPYASTGYVPRSEQRVVTTTGQWFLWYLLGLIPIIGLILTIVCAKDPTVKNYGKMMLILQIISLVICFILAWILVPAMLGYVRRASEYSSLLLLNIL